MTALVGWSSFVRFYAALDLHEPWIAPDEMVYALSGRSFWESGHLEALGTPAPFYGFYPLLAGLPMSVFGVSVGLLIVQAVQTLLMSLAGLCVFVWTRRLVSPAWAFAAALMTVASPALVRSGEVMTEALFFPLATLSLFLLARALTRPTLGAQIAVGVAVTASLAVRFQGLAFIVVICLAVVVKASLARDARSIVRFWPMVISVLAGVVVLSLARQALGGPPGLLGAYTDSVAGGYSVVSVLRWSTYELGDLFLLVLGVPLVAAACLVTAELRHRHPDEGVSALLAVAFGYCLVTVVQVGAFASEHVHHLAERDLISTEPPLFVVLAVWLGRGMPRPQPWALVVAFLVAVPAILLPVGWLVTPAAIPDGFSLAPLLDLVEQTSAHTLEVSWALAVAAVVLVAVFAPSRAAPVLALLVVAGLVGSSVLAQRMLSERASFDRREFFGASAPTWIDDSVRAPVLYLDDGDPLWNGIWQQAFWNTRVQRATTLEQNPAAPTFGVVGVQARADGRIHVPGGPDLQARFVVAPSRLRLVGHRLRAITRGPHQPALILWRTSGTPTLATRTTGVLPHNQTIPYPIQVTVFDCPAGSLNIDVAAAQGVIGLTQGTPAVRVSVSGLRPTDVVVNPENVWHLQVIAPPGDQTPRRCVFRIAQNGQVNVRKITFVRAAETEPSQRPAFHLSHSGHTEVVGYRGTMLQPPAHIAFCIDQRLTLIDPEIVARTPRYRHERLAIFVSGKGLRCSAPSAHYTEQGFAPAADGVPAGVYRYYVRSATTPG